MQGMETDGEAQGCGKLSVCTPSEAGEESAAKRGGSSIGRCATGAGSLSCCFCPADIGYLRLHMLKVNPQLHSTPVLMSS